MQQYRELIQELIDKYDRQKTITADRTGVGTVKIVGRTQRFDLQKGFPLLTLKHTPFKSIVAELLWFLSGSVDNAALNELGCKIWDPWAVTAKDLVEYYCSDRYRAKARPDGELLERYSSIPKDTTDWDALLTQLIEIGYAPPNARFHLNGLGPIYSQSWTEMKDERVFEDNLSEPTQQVYMDDGFSIASAVTAEGLPITIVNRRINQIADAITLLKTRPTSRRIVVNAWDARYLPDESIPPQWNVIEGRACLAFCHNTFQFITEELSLTERIGLAVDDDEDGFPYLNASTGVWEQPTTHEECDACGTPRYRLNCIVNIRSNDMALGNPFNIASYALLTMMVGQVVNMIPAELIINIGDCHLYANQIESMRELLVREDKPLPMVTLNPGVLNIFKFTMEDFTLTGYHPHDKIKMPVAV